MSVKAVYNKLITFAQWIVGDNMQMERYIKSNQLSFILKLVKSKSKIESKELLICIVILSL